MNDHKLAHVGRRKLGRSMAGGQSYGATARCECGARFKSNETPSRGGERIVRAKHAAHVAEVGA